MYASTRNSESPSSPPPASVASLVRAMTKWYRPWPDVMKIFWPVTVQEPSSPCSPRVRMAPMSLPASGSVMSMQPQARPLAICSICSAKRVDTRVFFSASMTVLPSSSE